MREVACKIGENRKTGACSSPPLFAADLADRNFCDVSVKTTRRVEVRRSAKSSLSEIKYAAIFNPSLA